MLKKAATVAEFTYRAALGLKVRNPLQGELYVQKRVAFKETYASHYDPAPGGVVGKLGRKLHIW